MIMIAMIKKENLRRRYFYFRRNGRVSYFSWKIWSEKEKENSAGKYLTKEKKKEWIRERKVYLEMENLDTIQRRKGGDIWRKNCSLRKSVICRYI